MNRRDITDEMVVRACAELHSSVAGRRGFDVLSEETGAPAKVIIAAMERAYDHGLVEVGVAITSAWPTPKGWALIGAEPPQHPGGVRLIAPWPGPARGMED